MMRFLLITFRGTSLRLDNQKARRFPASYLDGHNQKIVTVENASLIESMIDLSLSETLKGLTGDDRVRITFGIDKTKWGVGRRY